jgi:predicted regulator of Ras-like GTPase activity (Roadblock/LC7/MglB family)
MLEPSLDLYGESYERVDSLLGELLERSQARYALVIDRKGFVLLHRRAVWAPAPPSLDSLATLIASNYSANAAIAQLFGQKGFKEMVQQGEEVSTYIEHLGEDALLVTVFDASATLGRVKVFTKKASELIRHVIAEDHGEAPELNFDQAWTDATDALLDGLFGPEKK